MQVVANVQSFSAICKAKLVLNSILTNVAKCSSMHVEVKMSDRMISTGRCTQYSPQDLHFHQVALLPTLSEKYPCLNIDAIKSVQHELASFALNLLRSCKSL